MKNMRKMQKIRLIAFLTSILSALSLMSTGFATWYYVSPDQETTGGAMYAYNVETLGINVDTEVGIQVFKFTALSFVKDDGESSNTGSISIPYVVTVGEEDGDVTINLGLGYDKLSSYAGESRDLFTQFTTTGESPNLSITATTSDGKSGTVTDIAITGDNISNRVTFTDVSGTFDFTVTYTFTVESGKTFRNKFGKYIDCTSDDSDSVTKFIPTAEIKTAS